LVPPLGGEPKGGSALGQGGPDESKMGLSFTLELLPKTGNVSDLLGSFLDDQISLMEDPDTAMTVLKAFVSGKGTKRPANEQETIDNIRSFGKDIPPEKVKELIQSFVKLRVLRDKDDNGRYELRHDALAEKVYEKFSTAEKELLEIRQFIENAYQSYLKRNILLSNDDLNYISNKDSLLNLNPDLKSFLDESRKHMKAKASTVRRLTVASFLSFLILISTFGYFIFSKISETKTDYKAIRLMTLSDPLLRLKLTSELWKKSPGAIPKEALLKAFNNIMESPGENSVLLSIAGKYNINFEPAPVTIKYADLSGDNKYIYGYGDSLIFIWSLNGKLEHIFKTDHTPIINIKISDDNEFIGAVGKDSILTIWNKNGTTQFSKKIIYNNVNTKQIFSFTKENNVISLFDSCDAVLLDKAGRILQTFKRHSGRVNAVDVSPNNSFIATASSDKTINIWYHNTVKERYDFYNALLNRYWDTVWSAKFSKNNKNVICTSFNNYIIQNINNEIIFSEPLLYYDKNLNRYLALRTCYAEIASEGNGIVFESYSNDNINLDKFYYAFNRYNPTLYINNRDGDEGPSRFSKLVFSEDGDYYGCTEKENIYLVDNTLSIERNKLNIRTTYTLAEFKGRNPFFTSDSKYFIYTYGEMIRAFYIDIGSICKTVSDLPE
jgi:WD40 repeat protein